MMNDRFVTEEAQFWARRLIKETSESPEARLRTMYRVSLGRDPTEGELRKMGSLATDLLALHGESDSDLLQSVPVWQDMAHAVFNLKEFIYIR